MKHGKEPNPDTPLTDAEFNSMKTLHGLDGLASIMGEEFVAPMRKRGRPKQEEHKERITIRLDSDIVTALRNKGRGWQTLANNILREHIL